MSCYLSNHSLECTKITLKFQDLREYRNVMAKVANMKDQPDSHKVNAVFDILKKHNLLPDSKDFEENKNDSKSEEFRKVGNLLFASNPPKYLDALDAYNKSLCFAISKENQCLALTNRSAVFFKMEMFHECLESIRLAREMGIPQRIEEKVKVRAACCTEKLKKVSPNEFVALKISMPVNEKMPFLAKCLEFRENKKFGRHVITTKDISVGSVIAIKEPYCKIFRKSRYMKCISCSAEVPHLLMPCSTCTQVMFCSKECKEKAFKDFHAIECPISGSLYKIFSTPYLVAFRMTIKAFLAFPDTETLVVALEKMDREQKNIFSYDWSKELSLEDLYAPIRTIMMDLTPKKEDYTFCVEASLAFNLLKKSCPIFSQRYLISTNADNIFKNLMYRHLQLSARIPFQTASPGESSNVYDISDVELSICSFYSLLRHSCVLNLATVPMGSSYGLVAVKNIPAGDPIFTSYTYTHYETDKAQRQKMLFKSHQFHCKCQACVEDFPMVNGLSMPEEVRAVMPSHEFAFRLHHERFSMDFFRRTLRMIVTFMKKYNHRYPIRQLFEAQITLFTCLYFLCGNVPLKFRVMSIQARQK